MTDDSAAGADGAGVVALMTAKMSLARCFVGPVGLEPTTCEETGTAETTDGGQGS